MIKQNKSLNNFTFYIVFGILTFTAPFVCIVSMFLLAVNSNSRVLNSLLILSISYFFGLTYFTSDLGGDLMNYKILFFNSYDTNFFEFIEKQRKEVLFSTYSFTLNKLFRNNFYLYVGFTIFMVNILLLKSISKFSIDNTLSLKNTSILIALIGFFPPTFYLNGILFRQNLALALLFFGFSFFRKSPTKLFLISTSASLIHYVAFPVYLLSLINKRVFKSKNMIYILLTTLLLYNYGFIFLEFLSSFSESFKYLFLRIYRNDIYETVDNRRVEEMLIPFVLFLFQLILSLINSTRSNHYFSLLYIKYSIVFLLIYFFVDNNVLEYRWLLINYFFIPFILIEFVMAFSKKTISKIFSATVILIPVYIALFFFYLSIRNDPNLYKDTIILITNPLLK